MAEHKHGSMDTREHEKTWRNPHHPGSDHPGSQNAEHELDIQKTERIPCPADWREHQIDNQRYTHPHKQAGNKYAP